MLFRSAASGLLARFELRPPPLLAVLLPTLALPIALARSRLGALLADHAPLAGLIGFQAFRLPLELVMHQAAVEGVMPPQMTFTGSNFDIVSGATALLVALAVAGGYAPRWLIALWNALGSLLLLNILVIALASLPQVAAFGSDPAHVNTWVAYFPYVWLPAGLVTSALFGHAVVWRKLARVSEANLVKGWGPDGFAASNRETRTVSRRPRGNGVRSPGN